MDHYSVSWLNTVQNDDNSYNNKINQSTEPFYETDTAKWITTPACLLNYIRVFIYSLFIPYLHKEHFHSRGR